MSLIFVTLLCYMLFCLQHLVTHLVNSFSIKNLQKSAELVLKNGPIGSRKFENTRELSYLCSAIETWSFCAEKQGPFPGKELQPRLLRGKEKLKNWKVEKWKSLYIPWEFQSVGQSALLPLLMEKIATIKSRNCAH